MKLAPLAALVVVTTCLGGTAARADKAYVVASDQPAFAEAARAAVDALGGEGELLRADDSAKAVLAGALIIIAVGPLADRVVSAALGKDARVVECLTPKSISARSLTVPLRPSSSEVFGLVKQVLPQARKVAVFPSAGESNADLAAAARDAGLDAVFPRSDESFNAAVDRLVDAGDVIWIEDPNAVPNGGAALVVKKASDAKKQVVGPNRNTVQQGAFFAVVPDPVAHGRAAGEAALRLLHGDDVRAVPAPSGRIVINGSLVKSLGIKLPATLQRRAETVE